MEYFIIFMVFMVIVISAVFKFVKRHIKNIIEIDFRILSGAIFMQKNLVDKLENRYPEFYQMLQTPIYIHMNRSSLSFISNKMTEVNTDEKDSLIQEFIQIAKEKDEDIMYLLVKYITFNKLISIYKKGEWNKVTIVYLINTIFHKDKLDTMIEDEAQDDIGKIENNEPIQLLNTKKHIF